MGNDIARDAHCKITKDDYVARDIHYDITMSNDIAMCMYTYHGITMHNDVSMNLFCYVFSDLCLIILWVEWNKNKNKNKIMYDQSGLENSFIVFL